MSGRQSKFFIYGFIFLAILCLLFVQQEVFSPFRFSVTRLVSAPIRILTLPLKEIKKIIFYRRTYNEWRRLTLENDILKERLAALDEVVRENQRLSELLDYKRRKVYSSVVANVVGRDPTNWNATMIINKGLADGVDVGMPVVSALGVVGKISESSVDHSKVILLTDPSFAVAALVQRSREVGLVSGTLQGMCRMRYLAAEADVKEGDLIVTSKLSSSFPEGLLLGEVVSVNSGGNSIVECMIRPAASLSQIEEVLVVVK